MSTEEKLNEARELLGRLMLKADSEGDDEKQAAYTALHYLATAIQEIYVSVETIKADVREVKYK